MREGGLADDVELGLTSENEDDHMRKYLVGVIALLALTPTSLSWAGGSSSMGDIRPSSAVSLSAPRAPAACSRATANQLVQQHRRLNRFVLPNPVRQVLCGPFTGPGSEAMAVTIGAPTCWGIQNWGVFMLTDGAWRLVLDQPAYLVPPLRSIGSGIRETTAAHRSGDSRCFPSGGTRSRIWRWNGSRLVAGPWKQVTAADSYVYGSFKTPSSNIVCDYFIHIGSRASESNVGCVIKSGLRPAPPRRPCQDGGYAGDRVYLGVTGGVEVPSCAGDPGPYVNVDRARGPRLRQEMEWRRDPLHIDDDRHDVPEQEWPRLFSEP